MTVINFPVPTNLTNETFSRRSKLAYHLRSGNFKQGQSKLELRKNGETEYCCLGVACSTLKEELSLTTSVTSIQNYGNGYFVTTLYSDKFTNDTLNLSNNDLQISTVWKEVYMPPTVRQYLKLSHDSECILATLNDRGVSFDIIAGILMILPEESGDK